jgi:hypothetical protein
VRIAFLGQSNRCGRRWNFSHSSMRDTTGQAAYLLPQNLGCGRPPNLADIVVVQLLAAKYETEPPPPAAKPFGHHLGDRPDRRRGSGLSLPEHPTRPTASSGASPPTSAPTWSSAAIPTSSSSESYNGKLIAHSLGNFVRPLLPRDHADSGPAWKSRRRIAGYRFVPAWIDDTIPAGTGQLGREIMDRIADYSRPMDALVSVRPGSNSARIYLNRSAADSVVTGGELLADLVEVDGYWLSPPLELAGQGNLSQVVTVSAAAAAAGR